MNLSIVRCGALVVLLYFLSNVQSSAGQRALSGLQEILAQKLCICPCGNPKGGKLYFVPQSEPLNWFDSAALCSSYGMSMLAIEDDGQRQLFQKFLIDNRYYRNVRYWIGANTLSPGRFRWGLSEREVRNPPWSQQAASFRPSSGPFCVAMLASDMTWTKSDCETEQYAVICEY